MSKKYWIIYHEHTYYRHESHILHECPLPIEEAEHYISYALKGKISTIIDSKYFGKYFGERYEIKLSQYRNSFGDNKSEITVVNEKTNDEEFYCCYELKLDEGKKIKAQTSF